MPEFVFDMPTAQLAVWVSAISVMLVFLGLLAVKPTFRLLLGTGPDFNASISYVTSGFGLFYGLLLGLLTVAAYQNSERVRESIMNEATTLGSLYAQMDSYPEPTRSDVKRMLRDYVQFTMHKEWQAHRDGHTLNGGFNRANAIHRELASFEPASDGLRIIHAEVIASYREFTQARQQRLAGVITQIPSILWSAVLIGAAVNIFLMVLLRVRVLPHFLLGTITVFFLGVILFVIITLDRPLRGEAGLGHEPFDLLWQRAMIWDEPSAGQFN